METLALLTMREPHGKSSPSPKTVKARRTSKTAFEWDSGSRFESCELLYLYDGWNLIAELKSLETSQLKLHTNYFWGFDLSGTLQGMAFVLRILS